MDAARLALEPTRTPHSNRLHIHTITSEGFGMIILGVLLLILGFVLSIPILWTIGIIVLIVGLVLMLLGATGRAVGGRRHYW